MEKRQRGKSKERRGSGLGAWGSELGAWGSVMSLGDTKNDGWDLRLEAAESAERAALRAGGDFVCFVSLCRHLDWESARRAFQFVLTHDDASGPVLLDLVRQVAKVGIGADFFPASV